MKRDDPFASAIRDSLVPIANPLRIIVYDDFAYGDTTPGSVLQIAVIVRDGTSIDEDFRIECCRSLIKPITDARLDIRLAFFMLTESEYNAKREDPNSGFFEAALDGIVLYERAGVLKELAAGRISLIDATQRLGYSDAGYTLHALADAGLAMPHLPEDILARESRAAVFHASIDPSLLSDAQNIGRAIAPGSMAG